MDIKKYQEYLKSLQLYTGQVDGIAGKLTKKAVKAFQVMHGLPITSILDTATVELMNDHMTVMDDRSEEPVSDRIVIPYHRWPKENTQSLMNYYGNVGENQTQFEPPYRMVLAWDPKTTVRKITCHEKVAPSLYGIFSEVKKAYKHEEIVRHGFNLFGGCLNVRKIRGGNRWSTHAWGIAIDIDPARNGLKTPWDKAYLGKPECIDFVQCFKEAGWYSLGLERNYDAMHFQACWRE